MYEKKIPESHECGINATLKVLGGKWNALIIEYINLGVRRPSALSRAMSQASRRVINMALKELEAYGIIRKVDYYEVPLRVEYFLTPLGESLLPLIAAMEAWGHAHQQEIVPGYIMPASVICADEVKYGGAESGEK
ncbi:transcriptional regulator [Pedobacter yulinensis]|uniref:Transcriptional regulator n=1 Tax=Pedobacter yulinensis TaxID=2126353 RepID=A0A2T3HJG1_9SPHI|nr:helix-turn-helix domain-containing protein [Pedobacter yulinensis]PST82586.1 transcriptional regulator [Pedobacter yulinensis]